MKKRTIFDEIIKLMGRPKLPAFYFFLQSLTNNEQTSRILKTYGQAHKPESTKKINFRYLQANTRA